MDIEVAVAAGLAAALLLYQIFILPEICESPELTLGEAAALLAAFASYLSVPVLFGPLRGRRVARFVWLWTPVLGSLLCAVAAHCVWARPVDWSSGRVAKTWLALCVWTLPFAAVVNYSGTLIGGIRRWRVTPGVGRRGPGGRDRRRGRES